ncbi:protein-methionine-sulfoxide reductase heme-binding subunit MsrQ [Histidinibacterium lentulum]|uniref:Protein-methionine-sulfoxide reductase heme-binding subunit MsrQ n=1 Tax=Histidinibacterium lentulum TaxID=2480588 RepID=A0A3N2R0L0_9RHOB|nr:protein-methionine-sulfoxide reductase heme-binding subunit MsrQ [Histidinibacterium lentulum]ROU01010.1 protein-methionine-sulfoxide reductase heme-binding subunit MsrQ [Histidinibacterium lentulum]
MGVAAGINGALRRVPAWPVYALGFGWMAWLFYSGIVGRLGPEPVETLEHRYGELALQLLVAGLAVTPLRRFTGISLMKFRRQIGLMAFYFLVAHVLVWAVLDVQSLGRVWADIVERPYITIGMAGLLALIPLALTSNNLAIRKLGPLRWRRLHRLVYPAVLLGALHYIWLVKGFEIEPLVYAGMIVGLLLLRLDPERARAVLRPSAS